mmetsp:Transcript_4471/g.8953  ORF Transcript_4471/g.8953 Transcript_4471/m.8953 type:complete len:108 (+) Transcript_4471:856-1179(+)
MHELGGCNAPVCYSHRSKATVFRISAAFELGWKEPMQALHVRAMGWSMHQELALRFLPLGCAGKESRKESHSQRQWSEARLRPTMVFVWQAPKIVVKAMTGQKCLCC